VASLHTVERPGAPPLIGLVHGSMDRASSFNKVISALTGSGRHVIAYDRRGYAHSNQAGIAATLADHSDDLISILAGRRAVVAGHSLGADVAMLTAIRRPDLIGAIVVWEPPMPWMEWWPGDTAGGAAVRDGSDGGPADAADAAEAFMRRMVGDERWDRLPPSTKEARRAEGTTLVAELQSVNGEAPFDPADVPVPTVIGVGSESRDHHRESTRRLVGSMRDAELHVVEGAQHGCHLSHPAEFAALVERAVRLARWPER
jgi:pimeloyl-ACP methyl ester carboxylesterase